MVKMPIESNSSIPPEPQGGDFSFAHKTHILSGKWIFGIGVVIFFLGSLPLIVPFIGNATMPEELKREAAPTPPLEVEGEVTASPASGYRTAYGMVEAIDETGITVRVATEGADTVFVFELQASTEFQSLTFADKNDTIGTYTPIERTSINVGDAVAVYTTDELTPLSSATLYKLIKIQ